MKRFFILLLALIASGVFVNNGEVAPDSLMSVTPSATDGSVITSSDENTRNTNISTPYNAHTHTDITPTSVADGDGDTKVDAEESSDEDIIRMDTAGTQRWIMTAAGERTMPTQPAFTVSNNAAQNNIAIDGAVTIIFGNERFDQNNDFATNTFTAPVTGNYLLATKISLTNIDQAASDYSISITTSNLNYQNLLDPSQFAADIAGKFTLTLTVLADMDASDTATVAFNQSSGTQQTDIAGGVDATFSGYLAN